MAQHFTTSRASGETVEYWRDRIERARAISERHKEAMRCQELRRITSEHIFGPLMASDDLDDDDNEGAVDQVDVNFLLRYLDKMRALTGDEEPAVRFERAKSYMEMVDSRGDPMTPATLGEALDRLVEGAMSIAGAPEETEESISNYATEGLCVFWWESTGHPNLEESLSASQSAGDEVRASQADGGAAVGRLDDHAQMTQAILMGVMQDGEALADQMATSAPGDAPFEKALETAAKHAEEQEKENKGTPLYWRGGKYQLRCTRYVYGTHFVWDETVTRFRDARYVARLLEFAPDEAREFPLFRPSVRDELVVSPWKDEEIDNVVAQTRGMTNTKATATNRDDDPEDGVIRIWQVEDAKYRQVMYFGEDSACTQFLYDGPSSYLEADGTPTIPPAGPHPGFFPCYGRPIKPLTYIDSPRTMLGMPTLLPGLDLQLSLIKAISLFNKVTKQASAQWMFLDQATFDESKEIVRRGNGGVIPLQPGGTESDILTWKPPAQALSEAINVFLQQLSAALNFPLIEMLGQAVNETATQSELAVGTGNLNVFETVRKMEQVYGVNAHICVHLLFSRYRNSGLFENILGPVEADMVRKGWDAGFWPTKIPEAEIAAKAKNKGNHVLVKQLLDVHARAEQIPDLASGLPKFDPTHLIDLAMKALGYGPIPRYQVTDEERIAHGANLAAEAMADEAAGGGALEADVDKGPRRDADRRRDSDAGRGRKQPRPRGVEVGAATDTGPVAST